MGRQLLRCGHFDKTGRARGAFGCVFGGCEFVHPDSPDWAVARPSRRRFHYYDYSKDDDDDMEVGKEGDGQRGVKKRGKGKGKGGNSKGERPERSRAFSPPRLPAYSASRSRSRSRSGAREEWRAYSRGRDHGRSWSPGRRTRERGRSPSFSPRRRSRSRSDFRRDASPPSRARGRGRSRSWTRSRSRSRFKSPPRPTGSLYAPPSHSMVGRARKEVSETSGAAKNRRRRARGGRDGDTAEDKFVYTGHADRTRSRSRSGRRSRRRGSHSRSRSWARDTDIGSSRSASPTSPNTPATGKGKGKARARDTSITSSTHNAFGNRPTDKKFIRDATSTTPTSAHTPLSTFFPPSSKRAFTPPPPTPPSKRASMSEFLPLPGPPSPSSRRNPPQPSEPPPPSPPKGPAPLVPRFLLSKTLQNQRVNLVFSAEEKKRQEKLWDDRIKLFSTCAQASENLHTAREDLRAASGLANSSFFGFSEAKKAQIEKQYASLQARVDEQASAFQDMKAGVVRFEAAVWAPFFSGATPGGTPGGTPGPTPTPTPTTTTTSIAASVSTSTTTIASSGLPPSHRKSASLPPSRGELATGDLQQYKDTSAQLDALLQNVGRMRSVLQEVRDARARVARLEMEREEEERRQEQERLDRDAKPESLATVSGTRKRRDLGDESDAAEEDTAEPEEVQRMRGLLAKYARTTAEVQSDLIHQRNDFLDIASGVLDAKVETLRDQRKVSADAKQCQHEKERVKLEAEARTTLDDIKETQSGLDEQLAEVSGTLVSLLQQTAQIEEDVEEEKKQAVGTRSRMEQIRERMQAMKRAQESQNASLASLRADIDAAIQQTPVVDSPGRATLMPHPVTGIVEHPVVPEILQSLQPTLDEAVRRRIDETREAVKGTIDKGNAELYKRFWELTAPARAVLAVVEKVAGNLAIQPATTSSEPGHPLPQALSGDPEASRPSAAAPRPTVAAPLPPPAPVPATTLARSPSPDITLLESPHIKQEPVEIWSIPPVESASAALPPPSVSSMASHALQAPPVTAPPAIINIDAKPMPAYDCSFLTDPRVQGIGVKLQPLGKTLAVPHVFVRVHGERLMGKILIMTKNPTGATKLFHLNSVRYVVPTTRNQHVVRTAPGEDHGQIYFVMSYHGEVCVVRKHPKARGNGGRIQMPTRSLALVSIPRARPVKAEPVDD